MIKEENYKIVTCWAFWNRTW